MSFLNFRYTEKRLVAKNIFVATANNLHHKNEDDVKLALEYTQLKVKREETHRVKSSKCLSFKK